MRDDNDRRGMHPLGYALFGALIGGLTVLFADKNNRKAAKKKIYELMEAGDATLDELGNKISTATEKVKRKVAEKLEDAEQKLNQ